jgi:hypothetical protein
MMTDIRRVLIYPNRLRACKWRVLLSVHASKRSNFDAHFSVFRFPSIRNSPITQDLQRPHPAEQFQNSKIPEL